MESIVEARNAHRSVLPGPGLWLPAAKNGRFTLKVQVLPEIPSNSHHLHPFAVLLVNIQDLHIREFGAAGYSGGGQNPHEKSMVRLKLQQKTHQALVL